MGAIIFNPSFHKEELAAWRFQHAAWATEFVAYVKKNLPDDYSFWSGVQQQVFPPTTTTTATPGSTGPSSPKSSAGSGTSPSGAAPKAGEAANRPAPTRTAPKASGLPFSPFDPATALSETLPGIANDSVDG